MICFRTRSVGTRCALLVASFLWAGTISAVAQGAAAGATPGRTASLLHVGAGPAAILYADTTAIAGAATAAIELPVSALRSAGFTPLAGLQVGYQRGNAGRHTQQDVFGALFGEIEAQPLTGAPILTALIVRGGLAFGVGYISDDNGATAKDALGLHLTPRVGVAYPLGPVAVTADFGYQVVLSAPTAKRAVAVGIGVRYAIPMGGN